MMKRVATLALLSLAACMPQTAEVPQRRVVTPDIQAIPEAMARIEPTAPARVARANTDLVRDFMELSFRMESGRAIPQFSRFEGPVRVALVGQVPASARPDLDVLIRRLRTEAGLDIATTGDSAGAQIVVEFLPRATLRNEVPHAACFVVPRVAGWAEFRANRRSARLDWTTLQVRERATVFIPSDIAPQEVRDCLHEEISQALGPLNDLYQLADSIWNDDNFHGVLTSFDMLILRATYDRSLRSGMRPDEVAARLPAIFARANPAGQGLPARPAGATSRVWINAIESALSPRSSDATRRTSARQAVQIAQSQGWSDNRRAFSHFVLARLSRNSEVEQAIVNFAEAARFYRSLPNAAIHLAHVDMQMAAFALSSGQFEEALKMTDRAAPTVRAHQNSALLSMVNLVRAQALDGLGRGGEAQALRLDTQAIARYAFGSDAQVRERQREIAALSAPLRSEGISER